MLGEFLDFDTLRERISSGPRANKNLVELLKEMGWKGDSRESSIKQLIAGLSGQAEHVSRQQNMNRAEALAYYVFRSGALPAREKHRIFGHVESEEKLKTPVVNYLKEQHYRVVEEVRIGKSTADLVGCRDLLIGKDIVAIELKTDPIQMRRFLDQTTDYQAGADWVYLGSTVYGLIGYLRSTRGSNFDGLSRKLRHNDVGLLLIDISRSRNPCRKIIGAGRGLINPETRKSVIRQCEAKRSLC
jgi:hypothetical protein